MFLRIENNELKLYIKSFKDCIERERGLGEVALGTPQQRDPPGCSTAE